MKKFLFIALFAVIFTSCSTPLERRNVAAEAFPNAISVTGVTGNSCAFIVVSQDSSIYYVVVNSSSAELVIVDNAYSFKKR